MLNSIKCTQQDLLATDDGKKNLLFYAVYNKSSTTLLYLLNAGVDYKERDNEHKNIFHFITNLGSV